MLVGCFLNLEKPLSKWPEKIALAVDVITFVALVTIGALVLSHALPIHIPGINVILGKGLFFIGAAVVFVAIDSAILAIRNQLNKKKQIVETPSAPQTPMNERWLLNRNNQRDPLVGQIFAGQNGLANPFVNGRDDIEKIFGKIDIEEVFGIINQNDLHGRTLAKKEQLKVIPEFDSEKQQLEIEGIDYQLVSSDVENFIEKPLFSYGRSMKRETILFNPKSKYLDRCYQIFKYALIGKMQEQGKKTVDMPMLLSLIIAYSNSKYLFDPRNGDKLDQFIEICKENDQIPKVGKKPCIPIELFIESHVGVCRHHAIVAAYLLDRLLRHHPTLVEFSGTIQIVSTDVKGGAHAWITLVSETGNHWYLDTLNNMAGELNEENQKTLRNVFGDDAINLQVKLAKERLKKMQSKQT